MTRKRLPTRPDTSTRYTLSEAERYALCVFCVFETTKLDAFKLAHPEVVGTKNVLKSRCDEFFASSDVVNFMREYRAMLDEADKAQAKSQEPKSQESDEEWENKKQRALRNLAQKGYRLAENLDDENADIDVVVKLFDKLGWLDNEEVQQEQPRRYLPETCRSSCRYRAFVEQECDDLCQYCKYKKYGEDNGVHYESEKQLEVPTGENEE